MPGVARSSRSTLSLTSPPRVAAPTRPLGALPRIVRTRMPVGCIAHGSAGAAKHRAGIAPAILLHSRHCTWMCRCRKAHGLCESGHPWRSDVRERPSMAVRCARAAIHGGQMKVTIPVWAPRPGPGSAQRMMALDKARVIISRTRVSHWGRAENTKRSGQGNDTTHWRMGTRGRPWSTKWAALSTIRRAAYEGQNPLRLQMNGTRCPWWYPSHCSP